MTITLQAVNELIQSLESAGELSIKETKVLALAKAYQQLAAENVALKAAIDATIGWQQSTDVENVESVRMLLDINTPATDRIVAGIKSDEAKFIFQSILDNPAVTDLGSLVDWLEQHANDSAAAVRAMREGADK
ncbi:hypothetical protein C6400_24265 [Klebsiella michiganensis]|uniref:hypothetical protein n=1 Tax=Klebsiella michiganensis TaxID=1134687 RepID=UPI000D0B9D0C|nr:hypothetical protein [Klebsiella michiganensis]PSI97467.1 hypothetical protein C6400_24265 [Klebsiella michiganensis]